VDVRGGGASTRETDLLAAVSAVSGVTALLLTGGSAFGLSAAAGVVDWCAERGIGHDVGMARVPIVPAAVIFDLGITGVARVPGPEDARAACDALAEGPPARGSVGAGTGATVGKYFGREGWCKGGLGVASCGTSEGATVVAIAVVNAFGDVFDEEGRVLAGAWEEGIGFVDVPRHALTAPSRHPRLVAGVGGGAPENTTLVCVVTDATLTKVEATQMARMAAAGLTRTVAPVNTPFDGDVVFALATGERPGTAIACGIAAATATEAAIRDAVRSATSLRGVPTAAERRAADRH
jgi:L-aminopeptidase/D-esterase-like protein